jgi:hypothetical protein
MNVYLNKHWELVATDVTPIHGKVLQLDGQIEELDL